MSSSSDAVILSIAAFAFCLVIFLIPLDFNNDKFIENSINITDDNVITSFVVHPTYSQFSVAEVGFVFNNNTKLLSVSDTAVYKTGYYSINGGQWTNFTLVGTAYGTSTVWLTGTATKTLPSFGTGEHYIIGYSCKYISSSSLWDCYGGRWQLLVVNNSPVVVPVPTCNDGKQNQGETGVDCGGPCSACSVPTNYLRTFYVSSSSGNDANSGTSESSAWKSISKVNSQSFKAGDGILFKKGDVWRETLTIPSSGTSGNNIVFSSYGQGKNPTINGADVFTSWVQEGSYYYTSVSVQPKFVFDNGVPLTYVAEKSSLGAGKFFRDTSNSRVYISFNPSGHTLELTRRDDAIVVQKNYITIDGFNILNTNSRGIDAYGSRFNTFRNNVFNYITSQGIYVNYYAGPDTTMLIENNYFNHVQGLGIWVFGGKDIIRNNVILNIGDFYSTATPETKYTAGIGIDVNGATGVINTQIYNNVIEGLDGDKSMAYSHGIYIQHSTSGLNIYGNNISNIREGDGIKMAGSGEVHGNIIYNTRFAAIGTHSYTDAASVKIYNNIMYNNGYGIQQNDHLGTLSLTIYNNVFYKNSVAAPIGSNSEININNQLTSVVIKNNIFYASNGHMSYYFKSIPAHFESDYNIFYRDDAGSLFSSPERSFTAWQGLGYDAHSQNKNPLFVSSTNFHLQANSPAINAGINVGLTKDCDGKAIVGLPDIGACEK